MHMKSALVAISIIGLIVLIIHTIYTIKSISVGGTCDRGLHIVVSSKMLVIWMKYYKNIIFTTNLTT